MNFDFLLQLNFKKIVLIIIFLAICFLLGYGMYYLFFRSEEQDVVDNNIVNNNFNNGLPVANDNQNFIDNNLAQNNNATQTYKNLVDLPVANGGQTAVLPLFESAMIGPELNNTGNGVIFYNPADNHFYTILESGEKVLLSSKEFFGVQNVYWSNDKNKAIIEYPDGSKILFDFSNNSQITLSSSIVEPSFNDNNSVAYKRITENSADNWLVVSKTDGTETVLVESLGDNGDMVEVNWSPTNEVVALYAKPIGNDESEVYFIGLKGENFKSLTVAGTNFKGLWSPSGARLVYHGVSSINNFNPNLYVVDADGDTIGAHKFSLGLSTWVDKCVFESETILYCAVPKSLIEGAGLYPDEIEVNKLIEDLIYRIDLSTGLKELVAEPLDENGNNFNVARLYLSNNKDFLYFWNKLDSKVYALRLK